jgi:hypothetical protein
MNDVLNTLSNAGIDAYAMPNSCPSQTHSVLRQFQRINMVFFIMVACSFPFVQCHMASYHHVCVFPNKG